MKIYSIGIIMFLLISAIVIPSAISKQTKSGGMIIGEIIYDGEKTKPINIEVLKNNDIVKKVTIKMEGLYRIRVSENGNYIVRAYMDEFTKGKAINKKWHESVINSIRLVNGNVVNNVDITLFEPNIIEEPFTATPINSHDIYDRKHTSSISGTIEYEGDQKGRFTYIKAVRQLDGQETKMSIPTSNNIQFTIELPGPGMYEVSAYRDCNKNQKRDILEPQGKANNKRYHQKADLIQVRFGNVDDVHITLFETNFIDEHFTAQPITHHRSLLKANTINEMFTAQPITHHR